MRPAKQPRWLLGLVFAAVLWRLATAAPGDPPAMPPAAAPATPPAVGPPAAPPAAPPVTTPGAEFTGDPRRWWALTVLLLAQLMIILDIAIVNIALPSARHALHIAADDQQWILTAYLLPFGGLLLLGGRIADYTGRKRVFCIATVGFALASALGGGAADAGMLFTARALQGLFAAAMAPSLLSMLSLGFPGGPERARAFALYGGVGAAAGALGLTLGGLLTQYLSWRWCLLVNVPISIVVVLGALPLLRESRWAATPHYDLPGAVLATAGLVAVIDGIANAAQDGWGSAATLAPLLAGVAVLAAFAVWETRAPNPLLPLATLRDRDRAAGFLVVALVYGPPTGITLLTLVFLQGPRHASPLTAGVEFLPTAGAAMVGALASLQLLRWLTPRSLILLGTLLLAGSAAALTGMTPTASFAGHILPGLVLFGLGSAGLYVAGNTIALSGVPDDDAGLVSALINTWQQVGAAVGVALLSTIAASSAAHYIAEHGPAAAPQAVAHGNIAAFTFAAVVLLCGGVASAAMVTGGRRGSATAALLGAPA